MPERALDELLNQAIEALLAGAAPEPSGSELDSLVRIAGMLREMPADDFQSRLKTELERRTTMTSTVAAPVRQGFRTVTPYITIADGARLIDLLKRTFDA